MTLITSAITPRYVVQVSDRLLSTTTGGEFDARSNKSLVYLAPNAIAAISYFGLAYVDGLPTDEWIARRITGISPTRADPAPWDGMRFGPIPRWPDIGQALLDIAAGLEDAVKRVRRSARLLVPGIQAVGFQWSRRRPFLWTPIAWTIFRPHGGPYVARSDVNPRPEEPPKYLGAMPMPVPFSDDEMRAFAKSLNGNESMDEAESLLADLTREAASREPRISSDVVSIALSPVEGLRVRFLGGRHEATFYGSEEKMAISYAPWTIGSSLVCPPQLLVGTDDAVLSGGGKRGRLQLRLRREGPETEVGSDFPVFFRGTQPRPSSTGRGSSPWSPVEFREESDPR